MGSMISLPRKLLPLALFLLASCSTLQVDEEVLERITHQDEYEDSLSIEVADSEGLGDKIREDLDIEEAAPKTEPKPKAPPQPKAPAAVPSAKEAPPEAAARASQEDVAEEEDDEEELSLQQMPFRIGESVVLSLRYFGIHAGDLSISTLPMKLVNEEISYHFRMDAVSNKSFSFIYSVDDYAETFVGVKEFRPFNYLIKMDQKDRVGENKALFDWEKMKAFTWERAITKRGEERKDYEWEFKEGSQNVISAIYYLRTLDLKVGESYQVPLAHRGKNLDMTAVVEKRETLRVGSNRFRTLVIVPTFELDGAFKQVGDIKIWLTDDDQKLPIQIQAKIKIGTIHANLKKLVRGQRL